MYFRIPRLLDASIAKIHVSDLTGATTDPASREPFASAFRTGRARKPTIRSVGASDSRDAVRHLPMKNGETLLHGDKDTKTLARSDTGERETERALSAVFRNFPPTRKYTRDVTAHLR